MILHLDMCLQNKATVVFAEKALVTMFCTKFHSVRSEATVVKTGCTKSNITDNLNHISVPTSSLKRLDGTWRDEETAQQTKSAIAMPGRTAHTLKQNISAANRI